MAYIQPIRRCEFWACTTPIKNNEILCIDHYYMFQDGSLDLCPKCNRYKSIAYKHCRDCQFNLPIAMKELSYKPERSKAWMKGDEGSQQFYVYIMGLDNGNYYIGQTRDIRKRLANHRNDKVKSTAGLNPKLRYFYIVDSRIIATILEAILKEVNDRDPREITKLVLQFQDLIREVQID